MMLLFKIGFMQMRLLDVLDFILVGILLFYVYKLLKGSLAFNIVLGLLIVVVAWMVVRALNMQLLELILGSFVAAGVVALLIVFQPEVRRFLLFIGRGSYFRRGGLWKYLSGDLFLTPDIEQMITEVITAVDHMAKSSTGALIVFTKTSRLQFYANTGVDLDAAVSSKLLESIFNKTSPLHDGAVIIAKNKLVAANCVLPVSENPDLPSRIGLRHRAAVGVTDHSDALAVVVSEERGEIAYARDGKINTNITLAELARILNKGLGG